MQALIDWIIRWWLPLGLGLYFVIIICAVLLRRHYTGLTRKMNRHHESDFARDAYIEAIEGTAYERGQRQARRRVIRKAKAA